MIRTVANKQTFKRNIVFSYFLVNKHSKFLDIYTNLKLKKI